MRKVSQYRLICLSTALLFAATGCGPLVSARENQPETETTAAAAETVTGKVKEINGNEILLALGSYGTVDGRAEAPVAGEGEKSGGEDQPTMSPPVGERPGQEAGSGASRGERVPPDSAGAPEGGMSGEARGQGRGGRSGQNAAAGAGGFSGGMGAGNAFVLSGEERTILIPVTASVTTGQGENIRAVRFTQLAVKNVISLSLDEGGNILSVSVLE